jgi:hypothetical protein
VSVERFEVQRVELVLAPGLNLLVCPTAQTRALVSEAVTHELGAMLPEGAEGRALGDALVFSAADWKQLRRMCARAPLGEALVAAGMVGGRKLPWVRAELRARAAALYQPGGRSAVLNRVLRELGQVQTELRGLGDPAARVAELRLRVEALGVRSGQARSQLGRLELEREHLGRLEAHLPELVRLDALEAELARLEDVRAFPRDGAGRLETLRGQAAALEAKWEELQVTWSDLEGRWQPVEGSSADGTVDRVSVLLDVNRLWSVQLRALPERMDAVAARRRDLEGASASALGAQGLEGGLQDAKLLLQHREVFFRTARAVRERIEAEVRRLTSEAVSLSPTVSRSQLQAQRAALAQYGPAQAALAGAQAALEALVAQRQQAENTPLPEPAPLLPARRAFPVAGGLIGLGLIAGIATGGTAGALAALFALALGGAVIGAWALLRPRHLEAQQAHGVALAGRQQRLAQLAAQQQEKGAELERLAQQRARTAAAAGLTDGAGPEHVQLRGAELDLLGAQVHRREQIGRQMEAWASLMAQTSAEEGRARVDRHVAEARQSTFERELKAQAAAGPVSVGAHKRLVQLRVEDAALAADWAACAKAGELLLASARALGISVHEPGQVPSALEQLLASLQDTAEQVRSLWQQRLEVLDQQVGCARQRAELAVALHALLEDASAPDDAAFLDKSQRAERFDQAAAEAATLRNALQTAPGQTVGALRQAVLKAGGPRGVERGRARLAERIARLGGQAARLDEEARRAREQLEAWEKGEAIAALQARSAALTSQADDALAHWARERLALGLVELRLSAFRKEHREEVVGLASRNFGRLTGGAFVHVALAGPDDASLVVTDEALRPQPVDGLPRRLRELLFLAFRLAALEQAGVDGRLPLLVDAALTGFARQEHERIAWVLAGLSAQRQVIVLTIQPALRELFEAQGAHALELDDLAALDTRSAG